MNENTLTIGEMAESAKKRVSLISKEFSEGFNFLMNYPRSVTFFGSAKTGAEDLFYKKAEGLAGRVVKELHYSVITGGGPGIMEAANRGAYEAGGNSLGLTIEIPAGQITNKYLTDQIGFHYFFSRKVCLAFCAEAYLFFPGGFGTLDEFAEILTLVQTEKIRKIPLILVGSEYWKPLMAFFKDDLLKGGMIDEIDLSLFTITDDDEMIMNVIKNTPVEIGVSYKGSSADKAKENEDRDALSERPISEFLK